MLFRGLPDAEERSIVTHLKEVLKDSVKCRSAETAGSLVDLCDENKPWPAHCAITPAFVVPGDLYGQIGAWIVFCVCAHTRVCRPAANVKCLFQSFSTLFLERASHYRWL